MGYNKYFTKEDESYIYSKQYSYQFQYHVIVTFPNIANVNKYMDNLYESLNTKTFFLYAWHCKTKRKYKKKSNQHPRRKHLHLILFSNSTFDYSKYDTLKVEIFHLEKLLDYIHDGHHTISKKYFNMKSSQFREVLKNLRISNN